MQWTHYKKNRSHFRCKLDLPSPIQYPLLSRKASLYYTYGKNFCLVFYNISSRKRTQHVHSLYGIEPSKFSSKGWVWVWQFQFCFICLQQSKLLRAEEVKRSEKISMPIRPSIIHSSNILSFSGKPRWFTLMALWNGAIGIAMKSFVVFWLF